MLAKKPLTDRAILALKPAPPGQRRIVWDALVPGLGVRVTDRGVRTFVLVKRFRADANPTPRKLGVVGEISLAVARDMARGWLEQIARGIDPQAHALALRAQTFTSIAAGYLTRVAAGHRSREQTEAILTRLVYPALGPRAIDTITRSDVVRLLDRVEDENGPVMANHTLGIISRVFDWHASRSDTFRSPIVRGMKRAGAQERSRVLNDEELRAVWAAAAAGRSAHFGRLLRFILLTATRRNEALYATRGEIVGAEWTIPAGRYKTKIDHVVPLSQAALALAEGPAGGLLFSANGRQAIGGHSRHKAAIDEASGVRGWTLHDLRRTARSLMSRAGVPTDHAERCLGHVIGGVRGVYDRHDFRDEKRRAFEALASLVERIVAEGRGGQP
jgi:integrase